MSRYAARRDRLRRNFRKAGVDALLVTNFTNVTYLTGFTGDDSYLLLHRRQGESSSAIPRYTTQLEQECPGLEAVDPPAGRGHGRSRGRTSPSGRTSASWASRPAR